MLSHPVSGLISAVISAELSVLQFFKYFLGFSLQTLRLGGLLASSILFFAPTAEALHSLVY